MPRPKDKKLILVPKDLVSQLLEVAGREGKPLSSFVGEVLDQALRTWSMGHTLQHVVDFFEIMETLKSAGAVFTPAEVLRFLTEAVGPKDRETLQGKWYESGQWYGKYLIAKFPNQVDALQRLLQASRWDLDEVNVTRREDNIEISCISTSLPLEETQLLGKFIEGSMHSLGHKTKGEDFTRGIIRLRFEKAEATRT